MFWVEGERSALQDEGVTQRGGLFDSCLNLLIAAMSLDG